MDGPSGGFEAAIYRVWGQPHFPDSGHLHRGSPRVQINSLTKDQTAISRVTASLQASCAVCHLRKTVNLHPQSLGSGYIYEGLYVTQASESILSREAILSSL